MRQSTNAPGRKTKLCKFCKSEIDKGAKICPHCQKRQGSNLAILPVLILLFLVIVITVVAVSSEGDSTADSNPETITMEEFEKIEPGMTYDEVVAIVGGEGELSTTATVGDITTSIYIWEGSGSLGSNANVTFINGEMSAKAQFGLE